MSQQTLKDERIIESHNFALKMSSKKKIIRGIMRNFVSVVQYLLIPFLSLPFIRQSVFQSGKSSSNCVSSLLNPFKCLIRESPKTCSTVMHLCHACIHEGEMSKTHATLIGQSVLGSIWLWEQMVQMASDGIFGRTGFGSPSECDLHAQKWPLERAVSEEIFTLGFFLAVLIAKRESRMVVKEEKQEPYFFL